MHENINGIKASNVNWFYHYVPIVWCILNSSNRIWMLADVAFRPPRKLIIFMLCNVFFAWNCARCVWFDFREWLTAQHNWFMYHSNSVSLLFQRPETSDFVFKITSLFLDPSILLTCVSIINMFSFRGELADVSAKTNTRTLPEACLGIRSKYSPRILEPGLLFENG